MGQTHMKRGVRFRTAAITLLAAFLMVLSFGGSIVSAQTSTIIYAYEDINNRLVSFNAASPGTLLTNIAITGLPAGEFLGGIDFRPSNGVLYGVGSDDRIYTINTTTGAATAVSATPFTPSADFAGEFVGFDFEPVTDRIRLVNTAGVNIRIDPNTGQTIANDTTVVFAAGDPNAAFAAQVTQLAYSNNVAGATTTTAYAIDFNNDALATLGSPNGTPSSPNSGQLFTVGSLGITTNFPSGGFDIQGGTNAAYAVLRVSGISNLYTINLSTGAATLVGRVNSAAAGNTFRIDGIAIQPAATVVTPVRTLFDFDGDKRADASVFRPSSNPDGNFWYILNSATNTFTAQEWGLQTDRLAPADYDGDTRTDIAVFRDNGGNPDLAYFFILNSTGNTVRVEQLGRQGDLPISGDWDADGRADPAVYRAGATAGAQSFFFYRPSATPATNFVSIPWGINGDTPVRGDFDADRRQDAAVFRQSNQTWYIRNSSNNAFQSVQFGAAGDRTVAGDYDGDGRTDVAVFRPSNATWYILQSSNNQVRYQQFGATGDSLVQADYDADSKTDIAVWRSGTFYVLRSTDNGVSFIPWGQAGDIPVASVYNY